MPRFNALHALAACLTLTFSLAAPALAGPSDHPILVRAKVTETLVFTGGPPCFAYASLQGSGQAPSLGSFTVSSQDCVNPIGVFNPAQPNGNSFAFGGSSLVFTAGNGDRIFASYSGNATPQGSSRPLRLGGQFVVTGGTGAFFAATGGGILFGEEDLSQLVAAQGEMTVLGVLRY